MICLSLFAEDYALAEKSLHSFHSDIDLIELRIDLADKDTVERASSAFDKPLIITCRSAEHGGAWRRSERERTEFLEWCLRFSPLYVDVELGTYAASLMDKHTRQKYILSYHGGDIEEGQWPRIVHSAFDLRPALVKCIPKSLRWSDNRKVLEQVKSISRERGDIIGFCSGERGILSRVLAPAYGSKVCYCYAEGARATAEGQFSVEEAVALYRVKQVSDTWQVYGIAGSPVSHSLSPFVYNSLFKERGEDALYIPFHVKSERECSDFISSWDFAGLSITAPLKGAAFLLSRNTDRFSKSVRCCNTLSRQEAGSYAGFNTDGVGFKEAFEEQFGSAKGKSIFILGDGCTARSLGLALKLAGADISLMGRNPHKTIQAVDLLNCTAIKPGEPLPDYDVIINATSIVSSEDDVGGFLDGVCKEDRIAVDVNYYPQSLWFLELAQKEGCSCLSGLSMFTAQAEHQFKLLTGNQPGKNIASLINSRVQ